MSIVDEEALLRETERRALLEFYAEQFAAAVRKLLETPIIDSDHLSAVVRCKVLLEAYDADINGKVPIAELVA